MNFSYHTYFIFVPYINNIPPYPTSFMPKLKEEKICVIRRLRNKSFTTHNITSIIWYNNKERKQNDTKN